MTLKRELLAIIENNEEPFSKRIRIADNAFKSQDVPLRHKEAMLITWLAKCNSEEAGNIWVYLHDWLQTYQFKELSRNDVNNKEIKSILDLILKRVIQRNDKTDEKIMLDTLILLLENKTFQQYFKYNLPIYFQIIASILDRIESKSNFEQFLSHKIFPNSLIIEDQFLKHFLDISLTLVKNINRFNETNVFNIASLIVQKCIFYNNHNSFGIFINKFFTEDKIEKQMVPKTLFKYLLEIYKNNVDVAKTYFKLLFHAFSTAYNDFQLIFKFFITITHIIGFDLNDKLLFHRVSKLELPKNDLTAVKSEMIMCELLQVLSEIKVDTSCEVNNVNLTKFVVTILSEILYQNKPSETIYTMFMKAITLDPLIAQHLIDQIIVYAMTSDNSNRKDIYENLIIAITEVYFKLHRIENLIGKIVNKLNFYSNNKQIEICERYEFRGNIDEQIGPVSEEGFTVDNVLTENILRYFSKCIESLASWQVINVFKSLIFSLNKILEDIDSIHDNIEYCNYMEILNALMGIFLTSIRVAEHTVTPNTIEKTVKCLQDLRNLLQKFAKSLLTKKHHQKLMRSFLNLSYYWAETYMMLAYYSTKDVYLIRQYPHKDFTACNLTYLHTYLSVKEWCLIAERIMNFGEVPCKKLLQRLYIQKLRALFLFEENINDVIVTNIVGSVSLHLDNNKENILKDKFIVKNLLEKLDAPSVIILGQYLIKKLKTFQHHHYIWNSSLLLRAVNYVVIMKINKLISKHDENSSCELVSPQIYANITEEMFLYDGDYASTLKQAKKLYDSIGNQDGDFELKIDEDKVVKLLDVLKKIPIIFSTGTAQQLVLLYLVALQKDFNLQFSKKNYFHLRAVIEDIIIGILQQSKLKILDVFNLEVFFSQVLNSFSKWEEVFSLTIENIFKNEYSIKKFEPLVSFLITKMLQPSYMQSSVIVVNFVNKIKKTKMAREVKIIAEGYKASICDSILELVVENEPNDCLLLGFVNALKFYLTQSDDTKLSKLQKHLESYIDFALKTECHNVGYLSLFITVLQNKTKLDFQDDLTLRIWKACKENTKVFDQLEDYSRLIILLFEHVSQEEISEIIADLLLISDQSINTKNYLQLDNTLKIWKSVISCNMNSAKIKLLQDALQELLNKLISLLHSIPYNEELFQNVFSLEKSIIQTNHLQLTPALVDLLFLSISTLLSKKYEDFYTIYKLSVSMHSILLKHHKPLILDRLPPLLQQYRIILRCLCEKSNSDLNLNEVDIQQVADCAHDLEKLTKNFVACQKDMARIATYLIADILEQYEKVTLYPNVKIHLNNCIYSLISICDQHAVAFLMRVLSNASTEIFKIMYENYKKYYRFTGKV